MSDNLLLRDLLRKYPQIKSIAKKLIATIPFSMRLGREFWLWYSFFEESEKWSVNQMIAYQMDCLISLLNKLAQTSEFYREHLSGVDIQHLETFEQFRSLVPTLSRQQFRENYPYILSTVSKKQKLSKCSTSGTTAMALQFYHARKDDAREWAAVCHQWKRVGYIPDKSKRVEFRGLTTSGNPVDVFPEMNMLRCSILDLKKQRLSYYANHKPFLRPAG